jgi:hypothetical protein
MARIELRHVTMIFQDGLSGTGAVNEGSGLSGTEVDFDIDTVVLNTDDTDQVPVGARFTVAGETGSPIHTVNARTPSSGTTTNIAFTPAIASAISNDAVVTFLPQQIEIKVGDGNISWSESQEMNYDLDRGVLDTVRQGDDQPMELSIDMTYEHIRTGTSETITPDDALKGVGSAAEWVTSSADPCEPYAIDIIVEHVAPCGSSQDETVTFPDFRWESLNHDIGGATISATGRCNVTAPTVARS